MSVEKISDLLEANLQRAAQLIKNFKQAAVDQSNEQARQFFIRQYLLDLINSLQPELREYRPRVTLHCDESLQINSYPGVFSHIVTNFLMNSLRHGFSDDMSVIPKVLIDVKVENNQLHLIYQDNGEGVREEDQAHIFEPFFTTSLQQGGSGLGLHIVYNLVKHRLNGTIHYESAREFSQGVCFAIEFPLD